MKKNVWQIKALEYLSYLSVFLVPIIVIKNHLFGYTSSKSFVFMGFISIMLVCLGLYIWQIKEPRVSISKIHGVIITFMVAMVISTLYGVDKHTSFFGTFIDGIGLVYVFSCAVFSFVVGFLMDINQKFLVKLLTAIFVSGLIVSFGSYFSTHNSTIGNTSFAGAYLLFVACIGLGLFLYFKGKTKKILAGIGTAIILFSPVFFNFVGIRDFFSNPFGVIGDAKGAAIGLAVSSITILGLFLIKSKKKIKKILGVTLLVVLVGSSVFIGRQLTQDGTKINKKFVEISSGTRFIYWEIAKEGFKDRPLLGYGWGNYDIALQNHFNPIVFSPEYATEGSIRDPHNIFWSLMSTVGIIGTLSYLLMILSASLVFFEKQKEESPEKRIFGIIFIGCLVGYVVQNLLVFDTISSLMALFVVLGVSVGLSSKLNINIKGDLLRKIISVIILVLGTSSLILFTVLPWKESSLWGRHFVDPVIKNPQQISLVGNGKNDVVYVTSKLLLEIRDESDTIQKKEINIDKLGILRDDISIEIEKSPDNYKLYLARALIDTTMSFFNRQVYGKHDELLILEAKSDLGKSIKFNQNNPEVYLTLIQVALYENNIDEAYKNLKVMLELNSENPKIYEVLNLLRKVKLNKEFEDFLAKKIKNSN